MADLAPVLQPIGIFPQFFARQVETMVFKKEGLSLSAGSFTVMLANGTPTLQVEGKIMSISGRRKVLDMSGNHLFDIIKSGFSPTSTLTVVDPNGKKIMEVKSNILLFGGSKATAIFTSQNGKTEILQMKGNRRETRAVIKDLSRAGAVVARVGYIGQGGEDMIFGHQNFMIQVAAGIDIALIFAISFVWTSRLS